MINHPEQQEGEVFLGNVPAKRGPRECFRHIKSLRLGKQAYDIDGKRLTTQDDMLPLFIAKSDEDEYSRIYLEEMKK